MAFDAVLAARIRPHLASVAGVTEKKMFGGIAFMVNGNMACGVHGDNLIVRLGSDIGSRVLSEPHVRPFDLSGKAMTGWIYVEPAGYKTEQDLKRWIQQGIAFAQSLPGK